MTPIEFGLPIKYREWRKGQLQAVDQALVSKERFVIICAPTGFGKSLAYMAASKMSGLRAVVCTSTKGLQDQLQTDFHTISKDIRGQSNYPCKAASEFGLNGPGITVEMGPCHSGAKCELKNGGCDYYDRNREAQRSGIVVTNYALWLTDRMRGEANRLDSVKPVEMLVLDEAHDAPEALASHVGTEIKYNDITRVGSGVGWPAGLKDDDQEEWRAWGIVTNGKLEGMIEQAKARMANGGGNATEYRKVAAWIRIQREIAKVAGMQGEWVIESQDDWRTRKWGPIVRFDPLWPAQYAEQYLFRGVKKVILVSATVRPKTAALLGVSMDGSNFLEYQSTFPVTSRPVIHVPTVQMKWNMTEWATLKWIQQIDRILDARQDRKGIIHTVSYNRAELIRLNSSHASRMLWHDSNSRAETVLKFKSSPTGTILLSPSVDTGYDFTYTECEYQIIAKVPFLDNRGKVIKARIASDPAYSNYVTALTMVQMTGRGMRAVDDRCETLIVDDNVEWFVNKNRQHFPKWWMESYKKQANPVPLEKLK